MPVTVDEITAEVAPPEQRGAPATAGGAQPPQPSDTRAQREHLERLQQRAARVAAD